MKRFTARLFSFLRGSRADTELARELHSHLQLLEDKFVARGMNPDEARYAALRAFGGQLSQVQDRHRDTRTFPLLDRWWLDVRLALRMLVRYPGLTVVAVTGMAVAIAISVGAYSIVDRMLDPSLPLHEGDRIVAIQNWDVERNGAERRVLHDFATWRSEVIAIEDLGAFRTFNRTLIAPRVTPEVVRIAAISASGFRVARVGPILGRYLVEDDERTGAAAVVVIGEDVWRRTFAGDAQIIGRVLQLGTVPHTVVGVMPRGFSFPLSHQYWVPLSDAATPWPAREGPDVWVFGRLANGVTRERAQAELTTIGQRAAAASPSTHNALRTQVLPYTYPFTDMDDPENVFGLRLMQFLIALLLGIVCINVAVLVYARTATRQAEIAVRSALGAGRRRVVTQLFIEALVLASVASVLGVAIVALALSEVDNALLRIAGELPFWMTFRLTPGGVLYSIALAIVASAIVGVLPALKVTGRHVQARLNDISAGGGSGLRLGKMWTGLIVAQVTVAVALLPTALHHAWTAARHSMSGPGFAAHEFLTAALVIESATASTTPASGPDAQLAARFGDRHAEIMRQVRSDSAVAGVTFAMHPAGLEPAAWIDIDGLTLPDTADDYRVIAGNARGHRVHFNRIDADWLTVFQVPLLAGRTLSAADAQPASTAVVVNRAFVDRALGGANPVGRRFRYVGVSADARPADVDLQRWYDIVGVVADFPVNKMGSGELQPKVYHAAAAGAIYPVQLSVRVRGDDALTFATPLLQTVAGIDPALQLREVRRLDDLLMQEQAIFRIIAGVLLLLTASVVVLSAAGIYALMSCTVEQRRKEIGIRAALGANPHRLLGAIFARALLQLAVGTALGVTLATALDTAAEGDLTSNNGAMMLPLVVSLMTLVALSAAWVPARRTLRVPPTDTLRAQ
jgi:predicted permease